MKLFSLYSLLLLTFILMIGLGNCEVEEAEEAENTDEAEFVESVQKMAQKASIKDDGNSKMAIQEGFIAPPPPKLAAAEPSPTQASTPSKVESNEKSPLSPPLLPGAGLGKPGVFPGAGGFPGSGGFPNNNNSNGGGSFGEFNYPTRLDKPRARAFAMNSGTSIKDALPLVTIGMILAILFL
jgi:hypothetical protein